MKKTAKVETGVPIPGYKTRPPKYPWATIKVGESFYIPHQNSITNLVQNYNSGLPADQQILVTRRLEGKGQRVFRIEKKDKK